MGELSRRGFLVAAAIAPVVARSIAPIAACAAEPDTLDWVGYGGFPGSDPHIYAIKASPTVTITLPRRMDEAGGYFHIWNQTGHDIIIQNYGAHITAGGSAISVFDGTRWVSWGH